LERYDDGKRLHVLLLFDELVEVNDFIYPDRWA
jgi:hypothetical protein